MRFIVLVLFVCGLADLICGKTVEYDFKIWGYLNRTLWEPTQRSGDCNTYNNEIHCCDPSEVFVECNALKLRARRNPDATENCKYFSGYINSLFAFKYGTIEIQARIPVATGLRSLMLLRPKDDWKPAVTIFETFGTLGLKTSLNYFFLPNGDYVGKDNKYYDNAANTIATFKLFWNQSALIWYINNKEEYKITDKEHPIPQTYLHLRIGSSVGGQFVGNQTPKSEIPGVISVSYIKIQSEDIQSLSKATIY